MYINISFALYILACVLFLIYSIFRKKVAQSAANLFLILAAAANFLAVVIRWGQARHPPLSNLHESLVFFSFAVAGTGILMVFFYKFKSLGAAASLFCVLLLGYASVLDKSIKPLMPALQSNWLIIHVTSYLIGYAAAFIAFAASLLYLINERSNGAFAFKMDALSYKMIILTFPFLTVGITTGAVWANIAWGRYWGWDPKETWSLITWLIYAVYLHMRYIKKTTPRKSALFSILGFSAILFTFLGVSLYLRGLHSYAM